MSSEELRMNPDELRLWFEHNDPPFTIKTLGGQSYAITDRSNFWIPAAYEGMVCVAIRGQGIIVLRISSIESVQIEHDVAGVN